MRTRLGLAPISVLVPLGALLVLGIVAYARQLVHGDVVTGMRTLGAGGAVWGLYVVVDGFFLGAGVAVMACACVARFSRERDMEAVARIAMPVALACFLAAALAVLADQGRPLAALYNLSRFARPQSPLFATFASVGAVCLFASLVHSVLARRPDLAEYAKRPSAWQPLQRLLAAGYRGSVVERHRRQTAGLWMSIGMLPALGVPLVALAIIFTVRPGRPMFVMVLEGVTFVLSSGVSGLGLLVIVAALVGWLAGLRAGVGTPGFAQLGRALLAADALALLSMIAAEIAGLESSEPAAVACAGALLGDPYGALFWSAIGLFFLAAFMLWGVVKGHGLRPRVVVVAGVLGLIAVFLQRYLSLVAWQTHGLPLPVRPGAYSPTWIEVAVAAGILALSLLLLLPMIRLIPFAPAVFDRGPVRITRTDRRRTLFTALWFVAGLVLSGVGLALSLRVGTEPHLDPILPGSPVIFIVGLAVLATTGAVYELLPEK